MRFLKIVICAAIVPAIFLTACGYDDFDEMTLRESVSAPATIDIATLKSLYDGQPRQIYDSMVFSGYVTSNDEHGNFYRTFTIQDPTGGIEILAGLYSLHRTYVMGRYVTVSARGLAVSDYNGVLQLGLPVDYNSYGTGYFDSRILLDKYVSTSGTFRMLSPVELDYRELTDDKCGDLVKVSRLQLEADQDSGIIADNLTWATAAKKEGDTPVTGYRIFTTTEGEKIAVVTSGYASFADEMIPATTISVTGILSKGKVAGYGELYILKMRGIYDVERY